MFRYGAKANIAGLSRWAGNRHCRNEQLGQLRYERVIGALPGYLHWCILINTST
jgi:hypothetical protein